MLRERDLPGCLLGIAMAFVSLAFLAWMLLGCAELKPFVRTTKDVAHDLCAVFYGEQQGISFDEAARAFCATEKQLDPWLDEILRAKALAGRRARLAAEKDAGGD